MKRFHPNDDQHPTAIVTTQHCERCGNPYRIKVEPISDDPKTRNYCIRCLFAFTEGNEQATIDLWEYCTTHGIHIPGGDQ